MKKLLMVLAALMVFAVSSQSAMRGKDLKWTKLGGDSTTVLFTQLSIDTTSVLPTQDFNMSSKGANTTAYVVGKLVLQASAGCCSDTLAVAMDCSMDGTNWVNGSFANAIMPDSTTRLVTIPIVADADAADGVSGSWWGTRYLRWRVRGDASSVAAFAGTRASVVFE